MAVGEFHRYAAHNLGAAARHFRLAKLQAVGKVDARAMGRAGHWILERLQLRLDVIRDPQSGRPAFDVDADVDGGEHGFENGRAHGPVNTQHGRALVRMLALKDTHERIALSRVGALVDDYLHGAVALMNGARPRIERDRVEAVQPEVAEMTLVDPPPGDRPAGAVRGQSHELARASVIAVAVREMRPLDAPIDCRHGLLPVLFYLCGLMCMTHQTRAFHASGHYS